MPSPQAGLFGVGIGNSVQKAPVAARRRVRSLPSPSCARNWASSGPSALIVLFGSPHCAGHCHRAQRAGFLRHRCWASASRRRWPGRRSATSGWPRRCCPTPASACRFSASGGTSLLILLGEMGIMLSISRAGNGRRRPRRQREQEEMENRLRQKSTYRRRRV